MSTVLLTGATGLIGSNVAEQLADRGDRVRALVRPGSDARGLEALGVSVLRGDVRDAASVRRAAEGCQFAIHSAAVLGGPVQERTEHKAVNVRGTAHVLDAAGDLGLECVVALSTTTFFEVAGEPLRENSPLDPSPSSDPYTQTKRAAFLDAMRRVGEGQDVRIVVSGGAFGSSPLPERSMAVPSFNQRAAAAIEGELGESVDFPVPWVFAADVARAAVRALDRGAAGERYLAFGRPEDVASIPDFCNRACEIAGSPHRVRAVTSESLDDPETAARFGPSLAALVRKRFPEPFFDSGSTTARFRSTRPCAAPSPGCGSTVY
ncbi:MAG: NAD-dependent epimerase/dehydratase family protein [Proteobacteria bacterium]|nr:NAD-dependent epimerase/dehydratase family protein [Pseudomonadota bacterium]